MTAVVQRRQLTLNPTVRGLKFVASAGRPGGRIVGAQDRRTAVECIVDEEGHIVARALKGGPEVQEVRRRVRYVAQLLPLGRRLPFDLGPDAQFLKVRRVCEGPVSPFAASLGKHAQAL